MFFKQNKKEFVNKILKGMFVGYDELSKVYKIYLPILKKNIINCDINFNKSIFRLKYFLISKTFVITFKSSNFLFYE